MAGDIASDLTDTASDNARRAVEGGQQIADTVGEVASDVRSLVSNSISGVAELPENIAEAISEEIGRISRPRPVSYRFTAVLMAVLTIFGWLFAMDIGEAIPGVGTPSLANEPDWRTSYAVIGGVIGATVGYLLDTRDNS